MKNRLLTGLATVLFLLSLVGTSHATIFEYSDWSTWGSMVTNVTTENFDSYEGQEFENLTLGDVTFDVPTTNHDNDLWVSRDGAYDGLGVALVGNYGGTSITATFDPHTTAVATDVFNLRYNDNITVTVIDDTGSHTYNVAVTNPNYSFFGLTTDVGYIDSITFTPGVSWVGLDNFSYGDAGAPVPEPSTILLVGVGLLGLVGYSRKRIIKES